VLSIKTTGRICILDIDIQGVKRIKESSLDGNFLFLSPPSLEVLEKRLRERGTESEIDINKRLGNAKQEMAFGLFPGNFDKVIVNNILDEAFTDFRTILEEWYPHLKYVRRENSFPYN